VKNIARPVRVYRVPVQGADAAPGPDEAPGPPARSLEPPVAPSLAVLPFENMSRDPDQEYFSDGITEDIITDLSKLSGLFLIARHSTFAYKGTAIKVQQIGRELGVRYVLEGSVRKAGDRVRITAQLIDAGTGHHLWAERYDRRLDDIFAVQDEISRHIVEALAVTLTQREARRREGRPAPDPEAYDCLLRGLDGFRQTTREANVEARRLFERALELDADYAEAQGRLAETYMRDWALGWSGDVATLDQAFAAATRAVALDASLPLGHRILAFVLLWRKEHDQALAAARRAVALAPSDADCHAAIGDILSWWRPEEAAAPVEKAMRLNPHYPAEYLWILGHACYQARRYEEAIRALDRVTARNPDWLPAHAFLAATYAELGRPEDARRAGGEVLRLSPQMTVERATQRLPYKDPAMLARAIAAFITAGLPAS
jgi:TolB-like protein/cytochrome c-type biogenesis protein CcmH/NrfG